MIMAADTDGVSQNFLDDNHACHLLSSLNSLRERGDLCDVTLIANGKEIPAHRAVLAASSQYFNVMFTGKLSERFQSKIEMKGIDKESMELLVEFAYTGRILIKESNVQSLLLASDLLQFKTAKEACSEFICSQLDDSNCLGIRRLADQYTCEKLLKTATSYLLENFPSVVHSEEFGSLSLEQVSELLQNDHINVRDESCVFEACVSWVEFDLEERRRFMSELLKVVRLSFIPPRYLSEEIMTHPLVRNNVFCQDIVEEAKICHCECAGIPMRRACSQWLYVLGGETSFMKEVKTVECFDSCYMEWNYTKAMRDARASFTVAILNRKLYVIGGYRRGRKLNSVECYDPDENKWSELTPMGKCQGDVRAAVLNDQIFVAGGSSEGLLTCSYVERYDVTQRRWFSVHSMTCKRRRFALTVADSKLYAIGGFDDRVGDLNTVEYYCPEQNEWVMDTPMKNCRYDFGAVELSGFIYAIGGANGKRGSLNTVEKFDTKSREWKQAASMRHCRGGVAVAVHCGKIFAINGMNEYMAIVDSVECYNEVTDEWSTVANTTVARFSAVAIMYSECIPKDPKHDKNLIEKIA